MEMIILSWKSLVASALISDLCDLFFVLCYHVTACTPVSSHKHGCSDNQVNCFNCKLRDFALG